MSRLIWDEIENKTVEQGVEMVAFYRMNVDGTYLPGVAWDGVTACNEDVTGGEPTKLYANNGIYMTLYSNEEVGLTIETYAVPKEFYGCDGVKTADDGVLFGQQVRDKFGLVCKSLIANETEGTDFGAEYTVYWGCGASPSSKSRSTTNESNDPQTLSYTATTTPQDNGVTKKKSSKAIFKTRELAPEQIKVLEDTLYGNDTTEATLPTMKELIAMVVAAKPTTPTTP